MTSESVATLLVMLYVAELAFPVVVGVVLFACTAGPKDVRLGKDQAVGSAKVAHQRCFDAKNQDLALATRGRALSCWKVSPFAAMKCSTCGVRI